MWFGMLETVLMYCQGAVWDLFKETENATVLKLTEQSPISQSAGFQIEHGASG